MSGEPPTQSVVVFCGGTGMHWFLELLAALDRGDFGTRSPLRVILILPVSDDGGSSRAIIDAIGGPAVGDVRNVLLALASKCHRPDSEEAALCATLRQRLTVASNEVAGAELETILPRLPSVFVEAILTFQQHVTATFPLGGASIGNLVLTGLILTHLPRLGCFAALQRGTQIVAEALHIPTWIAVTAAVEQQDVEGSSGDSDTWRFTEVPMPHLTLRATLESGAQVSGQTRISYGTDGIVHKTTSMAHGSLCRVVRLETVTSSADTPTLIVHKRNLVRSGVTRVILGSGSFLTSTLASAVACNFQQPVPVTLLLNATADRETDFAFGPVSASTDEACTCGLKLTTNAVVLLALTCANCVEWIAGIDRIAFAEGSVFEPACEALQSARGAKRCAACRIAETRARVPSDVKIQRLPGVDGKYTSPSAELLSLLS